MVAERASTMKVPAPEIDKLEVIADKSNKYAQYLSGLAPTEIAVTNTQHADIVMLNTDFIQSITQ